MDNLEKNAENEPKEAVLVEEFVEVPTEIDNNKLLEDDIKKHLIKKGDKLPHHKCSRCKKDLGSVDQWFNYAIKAVNFGYTMIPQPLCKDCYKEFEAFMHAFDKK